MSTDGDLMTVSLFGLEGVPWNPFKVHEIRPVAEGWYSGSSSDSNASFSQWSSGGVQALLEAFPGGENGNTYDQVRPASQAGAQFS